MCCMADKWAHVTTCMCRRCCWCDYCVCRTWTVWRYSVVTGASDTTLKVFVWLLWADDWSQWKTLLCVNSSSLACLWVCWCRVCHSAVSVPCQLPQLVSHSACLLWAAWQARTPAAETHTRVSVLFVVFYHPHCLLIFLKFCLNNFEWCMWVE